MAKKERQEKQYQIERIEGSRGKKDSKAYLVKWVGFPSHQNTWEPVANLGGNCNEVHPPLSLIGCAATHFSVNMCS